MTTIANLEVRLGADTRDLESGLRSADQQTNNFARRSGVAVARAAAGFTAAGIGIAAAATNIAIEWESAFADVRKTVDGTPAELAVLEESIRSMATSDVLGSLENAHFELAGIAAMAGQLGVETSSIDEFTESIGLLTTASNLSAEEAATFAARFANVTGLDIEEDIDNLSNTIVELGNNMAANETDITNFAANLSSLSTFGFEADDILGYSAALASLDLNPELGSTNLIKTVTDITNAVANGTPELQTFADAAGLTVDEFTALSQSDPEGALNAFIEGLSGMDIDTQLQTLQELGVTGSEQQRVLLTMASGYDTVSEAVDMANEAWENSTAAQDEAAAKAETTQGAINRAKNAFSELGIELGDNFAPAVADAAEGLADLAAGDTEEGLTNLKDGLIGLADGLAQLVSGDDEFSLVDTWSTNFGLMEDAATLFADEAGTAISDFATDAEIAINDFMEGFTGEDFSISDVASQWGSDLTALGDDIATFVTDATADFMDLFNFGGDGADIDIFSGVSDDIVAMQDNGNSAFYNLGLSLRTQLFNIQDSVDDNMLNIRTKFLEGLDSLLSAIPDNVAATIPGLQVTIDNVEASLADAQIEQQYNEIANQIRDQYANAGTIDYTDPATQTDTILSSQNLAANILPEIDPATLETMRADVEEQLVTALVNEDQEAIEVLTPIANNLSIDAEDVLQQAVTQITGAVEGGIYNATVDTAIALESSQIDASVLQVQLEQAIGNAVSGINSGANTGQQTNTGELPYYHTGGTFRAPPGQSEGLAVLREGEMVLTEGQQNARMNNNRGDGSNIVINSYGESPRAHARMVQRAMAEQGY